jgi:cob(I)alamin adenosyltransferase
MIAHQRKSNSSKGLVVVFTGNGKGKTSAAMGILTRANGWDMRVGVIQFIKSGERQYGEAQTAAQLGIPFQSMGDGFVFNRKDQTQSRQAALEAWQKTQEWILSEDFDVLILDEITYLFTYEWLNINEVIQWLQKNKPESMHIVMTGRNAPEALINYADLATEMKEIKHPYKEGVPAQKGVDY